jgi:predicted dithiol-disulfide oxidoreductase (DUF899 family)
MLTVQELETQLLDIKQKLVEARKANPEPVEDANFVSPNGQVRLSELFGDKNDLLLIHNMGQSCNYCTLWADGLNGMRKHLEERAALVLVSPDPIADQQHIASKRGWTLRMVRDQDRHFTSTMGFYSDADGYWPGVSAFRKHPDGSIERVSHTNYGPGDDFCLVWPMFDLLADGPDGWEPN